MLVQKNKIFSLKRRIYRLNLYFYTDNESFLQGTEMAEHNRLGRRGEDAAVKYLQSKGHHILERNWRFRGYEIDIVTAVETCIVFVEVKTRASTAWGDPEDFVDIRRMRRMITAANSYLLHHKVDKPARFDVVAIVWSDAQFEIRHIEDAFLPFL